MQFIQRTFSTFILLILISFAFSELDPNLLGSWHAEDNVVIFTDGSFNQPIGEASFTELFPDIPPYTEEFKISLTLNESGIGYFGWITILRDGCVGEDIDPNLNELECENAGYWMEAEILSHYMCDMPGGLCILQDDISWDTDNNLLILETGGYPGEDQIILPYECENDENCVLRLSLLTGGECMDENSDIIPNVDENTCYFLNGYWDGFVSYIQVDLNRFDKNTDLFGQWNWDLYNVTYEDFSYQSPVDSIYYWDSFDEEELTVIEAYNNSIIFNPDGEFIQLISIDLLSVCIDNNENFIAGIDNEESCLELGGNWIPAEQLSVFACESNTGSCEQYFYYQWDNYEDYLFINLVGGCFDNYNQITPFSEDDCLYNGYTWVADLFYRNPVNTVIENNKLTMLLVEVVSTCFDVATGEVIEDFMDCESEGGFLSEEFTPFTQSFYFDGTENCGLVGDVNLDYSINVLDVMSMVNHILEINSLENCGLINSDLDANNSINVLDVMHVVNIILEQTMEFQMNIDLEIQLDFQPLYKMNEIFFKTKKAPNLDAFKK